MNWSDFEVKRSEVKVTARPHLVKWVYRYKAFLPVSGMHGHISVKLMTDTHYQVHVTPITFSRSLVQRSRSRTSFSKTQFSGWGVPIASSPSKTTWVFEQLYSSPSDRNATRKKTQKRNINKQLHNTQISESTDSCHAHGPVCQTTSIIGSATKRTRIRCRQIYNDNKESLNKKFLQELYFIIFILSVKKLTGGVLVYVQLQGDVRSFVVALDNDHHQPAAALSTRWSRSLMFSKKKSKLAISVPSNFEHRVHTGYDPVRGTLVGLPAQWASVVEPSQSPRPRPIVDPSYTTPVKVWYRLPGLTFGLRRSASFLPVNCMVVKFIFLLQSFSWA